MVVISAHGHPHITATHAKTLELATDAEIGPDASCVAAVGATTDWGALGRLHGLAAIAITAAGHRFELTGHITPFWSRGHGLVVRKSDFRGDDTLAVDASGAAADLPPEMKQALRDPSVAVEIALRLIEPAHITLATDRLEPRVADGVRLVGLPITEPLDLDAAVVLTRPGAALAAAAAALGGGDVVVLDGLPKGTKARQDKLSAALRRAALVGIVTAGEAGVVDAGRPSAHAVFRPGEVVAPLRAGPVMARLGVEDRVFTVVRGDGAASDVGPLLAALAAEGVSARTLRNALRRVPGLDREWDYEALLGLE